MEPSWEAQTEQHYKDRVKVLTDELQTARMEAVYWKNLYLGIRQRHYGKATEAAGQLGLDLFDEAEAENLANVLDHAQDGVDERRVAGYTRRIARNGVMELDASTAVVDITHDAAPPQCACGSTMVQVGEFVTQRIATIPAAKVIVRHHYPQLACPACLPDPGEAVKTTVVDDGGDVLAGTICEPALLATVVVDKMQSGLPLYRQEQRLASGNGRVSRQLMSSWMMLAGRVLEPLSRALERMLHTYPLWNADETGVRVLRVPEAKAGAEDKAVPDGRPPAGSGKDAGDAVKDRAQNCHMAVRAATAADGSRGPTIPYRRC
jgi:transposase